MDGTLVRYGWLSVGAAVATIGLKAGAYFLTGSVGLLSDAAESLVNLVAAAIAVIVLRQVARPADSRFTYGRSKAEYFSSGVEGGMIIVAASVIIVEAVMRFLRPAEVTNPGIGIALSGAAALINGIVGLILLRAGREHSSPTLRADGTHLLTDVVTSLGVILAVGLIALTGWQILDPLVATIVALNILVAGVRLVRSALAGLMDASLGEGDVATIRSVLEEYSSDGVRYHGLQTRRSGAASFANFDVLVPGEWSVHRSHEVAEAISSRLCAEIPGLRVIVHVEPIEDPLSYDDIPTGSIPLDGIEVREPPTQ